MLATGCGRKRCRCWRRPTVCIGRCSSPTSRSSGGANWEPPGRRAGDRGRGADAGGAARRRCRPGGGRRSRTASWSSPANGCCRTRCGRPHSPAGAAPGPFRAARRAAGRPLRRRAQHHGQRLPGDQPDQGAKEVHEPAPTRRQARGGQARPKPALPSDALIVRAGAQHRAVSRSRVSDHRRTASSVAAAQQAVREQRQIVLVLQRDPEKAEPGPTICTASARSPTSCATSRRPTAAPHHLPGRAALPRSPTSSRDYPFLLARGLHLPEPASRAPTSRRASCCCSSRSARCFDLLPQVPPELRQTVEATSAPGALADLAAAYLDSKPEEKQEILETVDLVAAPRQGLAPARPAARGAAPVQRDRPSRPRPRSTSASARCCCASRWRPSSEQLGEDGSNRQEIAELEKAIAAARMPPEVEARRARSCAACSACRMRRRNTA